MTLPSRLGLTSSAFAVIHSVLLAASVGKVLTDDCRGRFWRAFQKEDQVLMKALVAEEPKGFSSWSDDLLSAATICAVGRVQGLRLAWSGRQYLSVADLVILALAVRNLREESGQAVEDEGVATVHEIVQILRGSEQDLPPTFQMVRLEQAKMLASLVDSRATAPSAAAATHDADLGLQAVVQSHLMAGDAAIARGDSDEGAKLYERAIEVCKEAPGIYRAWPAGYDEMALAHLKMSRVATHENNIRKMEHHVEEAARLARLSLRDDADDPSHWMSLATVQGALAAHAALAGNRQARIQYLQSRLQSSQISANLAPTDRRTRASLATAHSQLAEFYLSEGRFLEAAGHAQVALEAFQELVKRAPEYRRGQYMAHMALGIAEVGSGQKHMGKANLVKASVLAWEQFRSHKDAETRTLLALIEYERGIAEAVNEDDRLAVPILERACSLARGLADPRLVEVQNHCGRR